MIFKVKFRANYKNITFVLLITQGFPLIFQPTKNSIFCIPVIAVLLVLQTTLTWSGHMTNTLFVRFFFFFSQSTLISTITYSSLVFYTYYKCIPCIF